MARREILRRVYNQLTSCNTPAKQLQNFKETSGIITSTDQPPFTRQVWKVNNSRHAAYRRTNEQDCCRDQQEGCGRHNHMSCMSNEELEYGPGFSAAHVAAEPSHGSADRNLASSSRHYLFKLRKYSATQCFGVGTRGDVWHKTRRFSSSRERGKEQWIILFLPRRHKATFILANPQSLSRSIMPIGGY